MTITESEVRALLAILSIGGMPKPKDIKALCESWLRVAAAAQEAVDARDAIQNCPEYASGEWLEQMLSLAMRHDKAMDELRAALSNKDTP